MKINQVLVELRRIGTRMAAVWIQSNQYSLSPTGIIALQYHTNSTVERSANRAPKSESWATDVNVHLIQPKDFKYTDLARGKLTNNAPALTMARINVARMTVFGGSGVTVANLGKMVGFAKSTSTEMSPIFAEKLTRVVSCATAANDHTMRLIKAMVHMFSCAEAEIMHLKTPKGLITRADFKTCSIDLTAVKAVLKHKLTPIYCSDPSDMGYSVFLAMITRGYPFLEWDQVPIHSSFTIPTEPSRAVVVGGNSGWYGAAPHDRRVVLRRLSNPRVVSRYIRQYVDDLGIFDQYNYAVSVALGMGHSVRHGAASVTIPCGMPNCLIDLFPSMLAPAIFMPPMVSLTRHCLPELCGAAIADALLSSALRMSLDTVKHEDLKDRALMTRLARSYGGSSLENRMAAIEGMASELGCPAIAALANNDPLRSMCADQLETRGRRELEGRNHMIHHKHYYRGSSLGCIAEPTFPTRQEQDTQSTWSVRGRESAHSYMSAVSGTTVVSRMHAEDIGYKGSKYRSPLSGLSGVYTVGDVTPVIYEELAAFKGSQMCAHEEDPGPRSTFELEPDADAVLFVPYKSKPRDTIIQPTAKRSRFKSHIYEATDVTEKKPKVKRKTTPPKAMSIETSSEPPLCAPSFLRPGAWSDNIGLEDVIEAEPVIEESKDVAEDVVVPVVAAAVSEQGGAPSPLKVKVRTPIKTRSVSKFSDSDATLKMWLNEGRVPKGKKKKQVRFILDEKIKEIKKTKPAACAAEAAVEVEPTVEPEPPVVVVKPAVQVGGTVELSGKFMFGRKRMTVKPGVKLKDTVDKAEPDKPEVVVAQVVAPDVNAAAMVVRTQKGRARERKLYRTLSRSDREFVTRVAKGLHQWKMSHKIFRALKGDSLIDATLAIVRKYGDKFGSRNQLIESANVAHGRLLRWDIAYLTNRILVDMKRWRQAYTAEAKKVLKKETRKALEKQFSRMLSLAGELRPTGRLMRRHDNVYFPIGGQKAEGLGEISKERHDIAKKRLLKREGPCVGYQPLITMVKRLEDLIEEYTKKRYWQYKRDDSPRDRPIVCDVDLVALTKVPHAYASEIRINAWVGYIQARSKELQNSQPRLQEMEVLIMEAERNFKRCESSAFVAIKMWEDAMVARLPVNDQSVTKVTCLELMAAAALFVCKAEVRIDELAAALTYDNGDLKDRNYFSKSEIIKCLDSLSNEMINDLVRGGAIFLRCILEGQIRMPSHVMGSIIAGIKE